MTPFPRLPQPDNRLYLGKGGEGKTTLALSHSWDTPAARVIVFDANSEDAHASGALVTEDRGDLASLIRDGAPRVCWRNSGGMDPEEWFAFGNRVAWAAGDCLVVWDEADLFMTSGRLPEDAYRVWNTGRHRGVRCFAISRRAARVSRDVTANLASAHVFRLMDPRDLGWLREAIGPEAADAVSRLRAHERIEWTPEGWTPKKPRDP